MYQCVSVWLCTTECIAYGDRRCSSPGARVAGRGKPASVSSSNWTQVLERQEVPLADEPSLQLIFIILPQKIIVRFFHKVKCNYILLLLPYSIMW